MKRKRIEPFITPLSHRIAYIIDRYNIGSDILGEIHDLNFDELEDKIVAEAENCAGIKVRVISAKDIKHMIGTLAGTYSDNTRQFRNVQFSDGTVRGCVPSELEPMALAGTKRMLSFPPFHLTSQENSRLAEAIIEKAETPYLEFANTPEEIVASKNLWQINEKLDFNIISKFNLNFLLYREIAAYRLPILVSTLRTMDTKSFLDISQKCYTHIFELLGNTFSTRFENNAALESKLNAGIRIEYLESKLHISLRKTKSAEEIKEEIIDSFNIHAYAYITETLQSKFEAIGVAAKDFRLEVRIGRFEGVRNMANMRLDKILYQRIDDEFLKEILKCAKEKSTNKQYSTICGIPSEIAIDIINRGVDMAAKNAATHIIAKSNEEKEKINRKIEALKKYSLPKQGL